LFNVKSKYIKIEQPKVLKGHLIASKISYSANIEKYFKSDLFYAQYDEDLQNVPACILQIPVLSSIITIAWAIGADVYVKELDKTYLESLNKIKSIMKTWYPKLPFSTDVCVEYAVSNRFSSQGYGLLFSGGIDSTTSYIRNKKMKPNLIMIWGADIPLVEEEFWCKVKKKFKDFAKHENVGINFVKTNMREFINEAVLNTEFGPYLTGSWWGSFSHGLALLGICAPATVVKRLGTLLIAASFDSRIKYPWGSHWLTDNELSWAHVKVVNDSYELDRQEKIRNVLKDYIRKNKSYPLLRVCYSQFRDFNCSKCEKCCRTITGLVLENINPNKCGFNVDKDFFDLLKRNIGEQTSFIKGEGDVYCWKTIQKHIPETFNHNLYNCKEFFTWFRDFDISRKAKVRKFNVKWCISYIYYKLPKNVRKTVIDRLKPIAKFIIHF